MKRMNRLIATCTVALLGGCAASTQLGDTPTVGGQIQNWPFSMGHMAVYLPSDPVANSGEPWSIDVNGNFSIMLPGKDALQGQLGPPAFSLGGTGCSGQVSVSPAAALSVVANFKAISFSLRSSGPIDVSLSSASTWVLYVFFDQAASASGMISCPTNDPGSPPSMVTVNLQVSEGWNSLLLNHTGESGTLTEASGTLPADVRWKVGDSDGRPGALCIENAECGSGRCFSMGEHFSKCGCLFLEESCTADSDCCKGTILQVLQPRFDPTFSEHSYGFRPGRSAHDAVRAAQKYIQQGRRWVVDIDLEKCFDRINHDVLMGRLSKRIEDKRMLGLIRRYLEAGVMINGVVMEREEGAPQGGPLSPILTNVLLDEVDKELEKRGHAFAATPTI